MIAEAEAAVYLAAMPSWPATISLVLAATAPQIIAVDEARFRVSIVFDDDSPLGNAAAQLALMKTPQQNCRGRGVARSEGTLYLNRAEPIRKGKAAQELSELYSCVPKP